MAVGDIAVVRVCGRYQSQNIVNNLHYFVTGQTGTDHALWQDLTDYWASQVSTAWLDAHKDSYELVGVKAFTARGEPRPPGFTDIDTMGNVVGDPQESYICRVLTLYGDDPLRRVNGRVMLSGGVESQFDPNDGSVTGAARTELNVLGNALRQTITGALGDYDLHLYNPATESSASIIAHLGRRTPALIKSRRVRTYAIG